ncbi:MAG: hypothetical protein RIQ56_436, partial [Candidatus Parcubacteria bacterium]
MNRNRTNTDFRKIAFWVCVFVLLAYFVSQTNRFVGAFQEEKRAHVLPQQVIANGWSNSEAALYQELPSDAPFPSFNETNSAFVRLAGKPVEAPSVPRAEIVIPDPPAVEEVVNAPTEANSTEPIPEVSPSDEQNSESQTETTPISADAPQSLKRGSDWERLLTHVASVLIPTAYASSTDENIADVGSVDTQVSESTLPKITADVPTCEVLKEECHTIRFSGFSVNGSITEKKFLRAELFFSFAGFAHESDLGDAKLQVRYHHDGAWRAAGEVFVNNEISNATNGKYFSVSLDTINDWEDLADFEVIFELVRGESVSPLAAFLESMWVDAVYAERAQDILQGTTGEPPHDTGSNVVFNLPTEIDPKKGLVMQSGDKISFPFIDALSGESLELRSDRAAYVPTDSGTTAYVSITNTGRFADSFRLFSSFENGSGSVVEVARYLKNVPSESSSSVTENVTYFCDSGWKKMQGKDAIEGAYECRNSKEVRLCSWLNEEKSNCEVPEVTIATSTSISYESDWVSTPLQEVPPQESQVMEALPQSYSIVAATESIEILSGQTLYFKISFVTPEEGVQRFVFSAKGDRYFGDLNSAKLRKEKEWRDLERTAELVKPKINKQLSERKGFKSDELPEFNFEYQSQRNFLVRFVRSLLKIESKPRIDEVVLFHHSGKQFRMPADVTYGEGGKWHVKFKERPKPLMPGKYSMLISVEEDGYLYEDVQTFNWGVLAMNTPQATYAPHELVEVQIGALSPNGNTVCDADLRLTVTDPNGDDHDVLVLASGQCYGNNIVTVPDYTALYEPSATGMYDMRLASLDPAGNEIAVINDSFEVKLQEDQAFVVRRTGPTRIFPLADYSMEITVTARNGFSGTIVESVPEDFGVTSPGAQRSGATLSWPLTLSAGESKTISYTFDAPNISPYLFLLGPLQLFSSSSTPDFVEGRDWQIASDAAGNMTIFWDDGATVPSGWTCVSCVSGDHFFQKFVIGSSTYGASSSVATFTHTASASVQATASTATENFNSGTVSDVGHAHSFTPSIASTSSLPRYRQLRIIQSNSAGEPATLPTGAILIFDTTVPSGWTRYSAQDDYYVRGENTVGTTGGSNTHYHTASGTLDPATGTTYAVRGGTPSASGANASHTHTLTATSTSVENHESPYLSVILGKLNSATDTPNSIIAMWSGDIPGGWVNKSDAGGDFNNRFIKPSATYGTTGGTSTHQHLNISNATTSAPSGASTGRSTGPASASGAHIHNVNITSFSYTDNMPPYIGVIFAKRNAGVSVYTQNAYRWYANENAEPPTDPWPSGATNYSENEEISSTYGVKYGEVLRLRMNIGVTNATSTAGVDSFKLQYAASSTCSASLSWSDVGAIGSTTAIWRGYNNAGVSDGATVSSTTLSQSNVFASYEEENNSATVPNDIAPTKYGEWDWVVQQNGAVGGANYCFRMVRSDGSALDTYTRYPKLITNASPSSATLDDPFDNEKATSTTPSFYFEATDAEGESIDYQI